MFPRKLGAPQSASLSERPQLELDDIELSDSACIGIR